MMATASSKEHMDSKSNDYEDVAEGSHLLPDEPNAREFNDEASVQVEVPHVQLTPVSNGDFVIPAEIPITSEEVGAVLSPATFFTPTAEMPALLSVADVRVSTAQVSGSPAGSNSPVGPTDRSVQQKPKTQSWQRKSDEERQAVQVSPFAVEAMGVDEGPEIH